MAIKYFVNEEKKQVIGVLSGCRWDAINKIDKMMGDTEFCFVPSKKYQMKNEYRAVVCCDERDEFDVEVGKTIAKQRIMERYYSALDKRVDKFRNAALILNGKVFETPAELKNNA